jgi:dihydroorotase-like cyclic amidohydrolase
MISNISNAILIHNGRIITACDDYSADVLLSNGLIHTIDRQGLAFDNNCDIFSLADSALSLYTPEI